MTPPTDTPTAPWEIPIREPQSGPPAPRPPRAGLRLAVLAILGVLCFFATTTILGWVLDDGGSDPSPEEATPTSTPITFAPRDDASTTTAPTSTSTTTTTAPPTTTTTTPPTTTTAPPGAGTGSVPELPASHAGGWAAMLSSVPYSVGTQGLEAAYAEVRDAVPGAVATRGERWSSVADGYWVLLEPGPYASADAVQSFCASVDTSRIDCAARRLVP